MTSNRIDGRCYTETGRNGTQFLMRPRQCQKSVVVTGASSGIGLGTVQVLTKAGFFVFGSVRKQSDADRLQEQFSVNFESLLFDVCDAADIERGAAHARASLSDDAVHLRLIGRLPMFECTSFYIPRYTVGR